MPAIAANTDLEGKYYHISNTGRDNIKLFNDDNDYDTFIGYLSEYLTPPADPSTNKKMFSVQGKIYHGIPHQPKNFHSKVNLVAYGLTENRFNLMLTESTDGAVQSFIRSLCTRYSIYFNKKYKHKGSLFYGPYKLAVIENPTVVSLLTYYLHKTGVKSSLDKYLNASVPRFGLDQKGIKTYDDFIQKFALDETQKDLLQSVLFGQKVVIQQTQILKPTIPSSDDTSFEKGRQSVSKYLLIHQRPQELLVATAVFMLLLAFGLKNVLVTKKQNSQVINNANAQVIGVSIESLDEVYGSNSDQKYMARVKSTDGVAINVYNDIEASIVYKKAAINDEFEVIAMNDSWCQVKLEDGNSGFIEVKNLEIFEE
ncbi:MAG: hypothetical protein WA152_00955 [Microgenomates group bacterium]